MKLRNFLLLTLAMAGVEMNAQHVSESDAREKALALLSPMAHARGEAMNVTDLRLADQSMMGETTCYYVFNNGEDSGFVIVAGDEVAADILGYSEVGSFDPERLPDNMRLWLEGYRQQIAYAANHSTGAEGLTQQTAMQRIEPLMADIQWAQHRPHNLLLDATKNDVPVGCVTTAATQVMYYYRWPERDNGLRMDAMQLSLSDGRQYWLPKIDDDYTYDWNSLCGYYDSNANYSGNRPELASAANLGYRMSRAIESDYEIGGTAAVFRNAGEAMINYFGYSKQMRHCNRDFYSDYDWEQMIYNELAEGRPVLYDGKDAERNSGHAFVCDGYDGAGRFSINWGWGGYCNGFFRLTPLNGEAALNPNGNGTGGAGVDAEYSDSQTAIVAVRPDGGEDWPVYMEGCIEGLDKNSVAVGGAVKMTGQFHNRTFGTIDPFMGFCLEDKMDATRTFFVGSRYMTLKPQYYAKNWADLIILGEVTANSTYRVRPAYKDGNGVWQVMASGSNTTPMELTVTPGTGLVAFHSPQVENNGMIASSDYEVMVSVHNPTNNTIAHNVRVYIYRVNDTNTSPYAYWKLSQRSFDAKCTVEETLHSSSLIMLRDMPLGADYYLRMYDSTEEKWISNSIGFKLLDPAGMAEVQADACCTTVMTGMYGVDGRPAAEDAHGLVISNGKVVFRR